MLASDYPSGASFMFLHLFVFPLFLSGKRKKKDGKKEKLSPHLRGCLPGASAAAAAQTGKESQGDVKLSDEEGEERERERERSHKVQTQRDFFFFFFPAGYQFLERVGWRKPNGISLPPLSPVSEWFLLVCHTP